MTLLQALILGIVQGITEFFPVSSSAHLRLFKRLLEIPDGEHLLYFDLLCHAGTLLALIFYLRKEILQVLKNQEQITLFTLALLPLVPGYFLLKPLRIALSDPAYLGYFLLLTGLILFGASKKNQGIVSPKKWKSVIWIGVMQTIALIPGISRSGSTIAAARFCGWDWVSSARFSFLLAIPTIIGGEILETAKLLKGASDAVGALSWHTYGVGFCTSFLVGMIGVRAVFWIYEKGSVRPFAWYCFALGLLTIVMLHG